MNAVRNMLDRITPRLVEWWRVRTVRIAVIIGGSAAGGLALFLFWLFFWPNWFTGGDRIIHVSRGATFNRVVDSLSSAGAIRSAWTFRVVGRLLGGTKDLMVGRYVLESGLSNYTILSGLRDGSLRKLVPVAIPEGTRMTLIAARLQRELGVDSVRVMELCTDSATIAAWEIPASSLEGYLLPDTYFFHWQTDERSIIERLLTAFRDFYSDSLIARQQALGMTRHEVITFASIVDRETQLPWERATVAGVYHNRLARGMRLEADPTIQYILPDGPRRLLYSDLRMSSPYNTYRNRGLPPGPIGNPGRDAIIATLNPERHQYLFFVADGKGGHTFSRSYSEHQRAVREYRRIRREMQRQANLGG